MSDSRKHLSRRSLLIGTALGAAAAFVPVSGALAAPSYTGVPQLPNEVSRQDTKFTDKGTAYEIITVQLRNDLAQLYVPHSAKPSLTRPTNLVWFYHANNSRYTALSSAFIWPAQQFVDLGWVSICPDFGAAAATTGSAWTNKEALQAQWDYASWVQYRWKLNASFLRANSGGGSLMTLAYGKGWVPAARGMYLGSATYDMAELYARDPGRIGPAYEAELASSGGVTASAFNSSSRNAARLSASSWKSTRMRVAAASNDTIVPPDDHGLALLNKAAPVAAEATSRIFVTPAGSGVGGHYVPDWVNGETVNYFQSWL